MSQPLVLSTEEIEQITGLVRPAAQERFFRQVLRIPVFRNAQNRVIVFRSQIDPQSDRPTAAPVPDFEAMDHVA